MRIIDPGHRSTPSIYQSPSPSPLTGAAGFPSTPRGALAGHLAILFANAGLDVSAEETTLLAGALLDRGFTAGELTPNTALRALLLQRNDAPLLPEIVSSPADSGTSLLPEASRLLDTAFALLDELPLDEDPDGALRTLVRNLSTLVAPETALLPETADPTLVSARTGVAFEWRLLAWYRAGRDPEALAALIRDDLKGTLLAFLGTVERVTIRNPKLKTAEDHARSLLDRITSRQTDLLTESPRERMGIPAEIPFGAPEERMYAGVRSKRGESGTPSHGAERCTLTIDIETTRLGPVRARLRFIGRDVAATFMLNDRKTIAFAESMANEFREMLRARGYEPVLIRFTTASERTAYPENTLRHTTIMNRRG